MDIFPDHNEKKLYQKIAIEICNQLKNRMFLPGDRLPSERTLAENFSVSRATIREAIIALEILGYVEIKTGAGIYVLKIPHRNEVLEIHHPAKSRTTPFEFLDIRLLIEPHFAEVAATEATPQDIEAFKQILQDTATISEPEEYYNFDKKFHKLIANSTKIGLAENIMKELWSASEESLMPYNFNKHFVTLESWKVSLKEHEAIIEAIINREPSLAKHAMYHHLSGVLLRLRHDF